MPVGPEDLPDEQIAQLFAAARVVREQQESARGRQDERHADDRFLNLAEASVGPRQQQAARECGRERRDLRRDAVRIETEAAGRNDAQAGHLRHGQVDEDDAATQNFAAERHVRRENERARDHRRPDDRKTGRVEIHCRASSKVFTITSNMPNRSSVPGRLPTVCGKTIEGIDVRPASHSDALPSS